MSIVLFALIGASLEAGLAYWICFGVFCMFKILKFILDFMKTIKEDD